jgi:NH3-dependent NAD+ synthetase
MKPSGQHPLCKAVGRAGSSRRTRIAATLSGADDILECLVEKERRHEIVARGHEIATVHRVEHLLYLAEYKRRQSAPGVKITRKNFGRDRRYPITNRFRDR